MKFNPQKPFDYAPQKITGTSQDRHYRRSIRLPDYDYAVPFRG